MRYVRNGEEFEREISPLGLVLASGDWYLVALRDGQRRTYRVSRVAAVEPLDEPVTRPDGFDLADSWARARRELEDETGRSVEVTLRVAARVLPRLRRQLPVHGQDRVPLTATGEAELTLPFDDEAWAFSCILSLGAAVEVLGPPEFRRRIAAESRRAAARYGTVSTDPPS
jgi:predicted DNA-binding transcriptional regulator YafY